MSFGGFLGIGEKYHPLPWDLLDYDTEAGGYCLDLDRDDLVDAPSYDRAALNAYDFDNDSGGVGAYYTRRFRTTASNRAIADAEISDDVSGTPVVPPGGVGSANGPGASATFSTTASAVAVNPAATVLYVGDTTNNLLRGVL
jgi:hypothetical protein